MTCVGFVLYGSMVLLPIWLQTLLGYPALQAGIAMAPRGMGSFIAMPIVGALLARGDPRKFLAAGLLISALDDVRSSRGSTWMPATGTSSGRSSFRAFRLGCSSSR